MYKIINRVKTLLLCVIMIFNSVFSFAQNDYDHDCDCYQVEDVIENGQRYQKFVFLDDQGNCTGGYLQPYDDSHPPILFHQIASTHYETSSESSITQSKSPSQSSMTQLESFHTKSVSGMKQRAISNSQVTQQQHIDNLFFQGRITAGQAFARYQQMAYRPSVLALTKSEIREASKKEKVKQALILQKEKAEQKLILQKEQAEKALIASIVKKFNLSLEDIQTLHVQNNSYLTKKSCDENSSFFKVMEERKKAFEDTLQNKKITIQSIKLKIHTIDLLQEQKIKTNLFEMVSGLPIQHQLTQELVGILTQMTSEGMQYRDQKDLVLHCTKLVHMAQQANVDGQLQQAIDGANCCHGMYHYLKGVQRGCSNALQHFTTALRYFDAATDHYASLIAENFVQGAITNYGLEAIARIGIASAPTITVAAITIMIGATVCLMAPMCYQAGQFLWAGIRCDWDKVNKDLDRFRNFMGSKEAVAGLARFSSGWFSRTPTLNYVTNKILSLRPVIARTQQKTGQMISKIRLMTPDKISQAVKESVEALNLPELKDFIFKYTKIFGVHIFHGYFKDNPALVTAIEGVQPGLVNLIENSLMTKFCTQAEDSIVGTVIKNVEESIVGSIVKNEATEIIKSIAPVIENAVENIGQSIVSMQSIVQQEIQQQLQQPCKIIETNLSSPIDALQASKLRDLSRNIDKLNNLAEYTNNFQDLAKLMREEVMHLNRICQLEPYRVQIKNFLDQNKLFRMHNGKKYCIKDIDSYHVHAADYSQTVKLTGGHSNYGGNKLDHFKPGLIKEGPLGAKDVMLHHPRSFNLRKRSTIYPEAWSEYICDLKAIEVMLSENVTITISDNLQYLLFEGLTSEGLITKVVYEIITETIKTHYLLSKEF